MAGLLETYLQDIRITYPNMLDRDEWRQIRYGITDSAIEQTASPMSIITAELKEKAFASEGRNVDIPVIKKGEITLKAGRSCNITQFENESAMMGLSWNTLVADISMVKAQYAKNEISYLQDLARKLQLVREAFMSQLETAGLAKLEAAKSLVYGSTLVGAGNKYALTGSAVRVPLALQDFFFNDVGPIQQADNFYGDQYILASTALQSPVNKFYNQGTSNALNQNYQFSDKTFRFSNDITSGAGVMSTGYIMPIGTLGILNRVDTTAMMGAKAGDGTEWTVENLPGIPFPVGVMYKSVCSDQSALNGTGLEHLKATMLETWQISMDYAFITPYNSDSATKASAIKKFEFLNV